MDKMQTQNDLSRLIANDTLKPQPCSIVIPSHNRCKQLERALQQLARQTYPVNLLELIVVLDGCTDDSAKMLEQLQPNFPISLRVLEQTQGGPSAARNAGVRAAQTEYILFIDDDVMATPQLIMEHWHFYCSHPDTVAVGPMSKPSDSKGSIWVRWEEFVLEKQYREIVAGKYKFTPRQFYTGNSFLKRDWIMKAGLFDETFKRYEDVALGYQLEKQKLSFAFNPAAVGYHYPRRTYKAWTNMHYLYGRYAVKIDTLNPDLYMVDTVHEEFEKRNRVTRYLSAKLLNHKKAQKGVAWLFMGLAHLTSLLKLERYGYKLLSAVANILFWQGFNEELNLTSASIDRNLKP